MALVPTTKLEAVNVCLTNIGEAPVTSLESGLLVDAQIASDIVDEISREVQSIGWNFNTEEFDLTPDTDGFINLPASTLRVDSVKTNFHEDLIMRGSRLYDKDNNTYVFTEGKTVEVILYLVFDELPETVRRFIALRAARVFQERQLGVDALSAQNREDERRAWAMLMSEEADSADYNILSGTPTVSRIVSRQVYPGWRSV